MSPVSSFLAPPERSSKPAPSAAPDELQDLVAQVILDWRADPVGVEFRPTTREVLDRHPQLERHQSLVLDLAVEEYCLRRDRGAPVDPVAFAAQFPQAGQALAALLILFQAKVHQITKLVRTPTVKWPQPNEIINGFLLLTELHRGQLSRVYLAAEVCLAQRLVVVKIVATQTLEGELLGRLSHANIVPIHSMQRLSLGRHGSDGSADCTLVVMPFMGCTTLADIRNKCWHAGSRPSSAAMILEALSDGALGHDSSTKSANETCLSKSDSYDVAIIRIIIQVSRALAFAHSKQIVHRDLKPQNVLVAPNGSPLLMDFGVSASADSSAVNIAGTIPYMAPECLSLIAGGHEDGSFGERRTSLCDLRPDHRSDIFSVGVILYEMLTGSLPFGVPSSRASVMQQAEAIAARQHRNPLCRNERNRHVPEDLFRLLDRCLSPTIDQRPESASVVADLLEEYLVTLDGPVRVASSRRAFFKRAVVGIAAASCSALGAGYISGRRVDLITSAATAYDRGDYSASLAFFKEATEEHKNFESSSDVSQQSLFAASTFGAGQCLRKLNEIGNAVAQLKESVRALLHPISLATLAYLMGIDGKDDDALAVGDLAIQKMRYAGGAELAAGPRRVHACTLNNHGYQLLRGRQYGNAESTLLSAKAKFASMSEEATIVWSNRLDGWVRCYADGYMSRDLLSSLVRQVPSCDEASPKSGLFYFMLARAAAMSRVQGNSSVGSHVEKYLLLAVAGGCNRRMLEEADALRKVLAEIHVPDVFFQAAATRSVSLSDLLLVPTDSCLMQMWHEMS